MRPFVLKDAKAVTCQSGKTPRGRLKLDFRRPLGIIGSFSAFGLRGIPDSSLFFRFAADNQQRQVALTHDGFGKAAHQEVH